MATNRQGWIRPRPGATAELKVNSNSRVTIRYDDDLDNSGNTDTVVRAEAHVETTPPQALISEPDDGLNTQARRLDFRGTVTDDRSGLHIDSLRLIIDQGDDPDNNNQVVSGGVGDSRYSMTAAAQAFSLGIEDPEDGQTSVAWSVTGSGALPTSVVAVQPDHQVDFIVIAKDLAGNIGYSDSDSTTSAVGVGAEAHEPHVITIDQVRPNLTSAVTGVAADGPDDDKAEETNNRRSIAVRFDDTVEDVDASDFEVTQSDGTNLVPVGASASGGNVYLELEADLPTDDTPTVRLTGSVSDPAGNATSSGSVKASDMLSPVLTVELSGGSGTGEGANGPSALTKNEITVTISSDEKLAGLPMVNVLQLRRSCRKAVRGLTGRRDVDSAGDCRQA